MSARIDTRFATAKDTAHALGVPSSRVKKLLRALNSATQLKQSSSHVGISSKKAADSPQNNHQHVGTVWYKAGGSGVKKSSPKRRITGKRGASASKRRARGKTAKTTR